MPANKSYEQGYASGYAGEPLNETLALRSANYCEGWDAGNCDRPSLADLTFDYAKEVSNPLIF